MSANEENRPKQLRASRNLRATEAGSPSRTEQGSVVRNAGMGSDARAGISKVVYLAARRGKCGKIGRVEAGILMESGSEEPVRSKSATGRLKEDVQNKVDHVHGHIERKRKGSRRCRAGSV